MLAQKFTIGSKALTVFSYRKFATTEAFALTGGNLYQNFSKSALTHYVAIVVVISALKIPCFHLIRNDFIILKRVFGIKDLSEKYELAKLYQHYLHVYHKKTYIFMKVSEQYFLKVQFYLCSSVPNSERLGIRR